MDVRSKLVEEPAESGNFESVTEVTFDDTPEDAYVKKALLNALEGPQIVGIKKGDDKYAESGGIILSGLVSYDRIVHISFLSTMNIVVNQDYL